MPLNDTVNQLKNERCKKIRWFYVLSCIFFLCLFPSFSFYCYFTAKHNAFQYKYIITYILKLLSWILPVTQIHFYRITQQFWSHSKWKSLSLGQNWTFKLFKYWNQVVESTFEPFVIKELQKYYKVNYCFFWASQQTTSRILTEQSFCGRDIVKQLLHIYSFLHGHDGQTCVNRMI